jgi:hypothetical protein
LISAKHARNSTIRSGSGSCIVSLTIEQRREELTESRARTDSFPIISTAGAASLATLPILSSISSWWGYEKSVVSCCDSGRVRGEDPILVVRPYTVSII